MAIGEVLKLVKSMFGCVIVRLAKYKLVLVAFLIIGVIIL